MAFKVQGNLVFEERSFIHKNKRNYQEQSHSFEKRTERVLKTEQNGTDISLKERLTSGTLSFYQELILSQEWISNHECVLIHLEIIKRPPPPSIPFPSLLFPDLPSP